MENNQKSSASKTYRVWADHVTRVYQEVEAESPERARELAWEQPECWQDCYEFEDRDDYQLADEVQDVATQEYFTVADVEHCKTCGSAIEATVNGSNFKEGECGPCEHRRYTSQPGLVTALTLARDEIVGVKMFKDRRSEDYKRLGHLLNVIDTSFAKAYGKAS